MAPPHSSRALFLSLALTATVALVVLIANMLSPVSHPVAMQPENLPPVLIDRAPARGEEQPIDAPIRLVFDRPMDRASVEAAFELSPRVPGTLTWSDDDAVVQFTPLDGGFAPGETYQVSLRDTARAANSKTLAQAASFTFQTTGFLRVAQTLPADGVTQIDPQTAITVMFNRPAVPLVAVADQSELPQPLELDPPVAGAGEWLNTSIYLFRPDQRLKSGVTYTARVAAGLTDVTGAALPQDVVWSFTTSTPGVLSTSPHDTETDVWPDRDVRVTFTDPMERSSAEAAFSLRAGINGPAVPGKFTWISDTLVFTPTELLERGVTYAAVLAAGARSETGATIPADYLWTFRVLPPLAVVSTDPPDGASEVEPYRPPQIYFSAPISTSTLFPNTRVDPPISATEVYSYYDRYNLRYVYDFGPEPSSSYTVTIGAGVTDLWGQMLGEDVALHFSTRPFKPAQRFEGVKRLGIYSPYTDTVVYIRYLNVSRIDFELYTATPGELAQLVGSNSYQVWRDHAVPVIDRAPLRTWSVDVDKPLNQSGLRRITLTPPDFGGSREGGEGGALPTGIYLLRVSSPEQSANDFWGLTRHVLIVADTNLTFKWAEREGLVWAADLLSGRDISSGRVRIYDDRSRLAASGRVDQHGVFRARWPDRVDPSQPLVAVFGRPGGRYGIALSGWSGRLWPSDVTAGYFTVSEPYNVYLYTEKPLYRPGQTVHFKGIARLDDDARYAIDPNLTSIHVDVYDWRETLVHSADLPLTTVGTLSGDFALSPEAALGAYEIRARIPILNPNTSQPEDHVYRRQFVVSEYRRPEFQVAVAAADNEVLQGDTINVDVQATYFFGGPVGGAQVKWNVLSRDYFFDRYGGSGYFSWSDLSLSDPYASGSSFGKSIASGEGQTDVNGRLRISLPASLADQTRSQRFSIEAIVTDINAQQSAGGVDVVVHQGRYYIGLSPERYVGVVGQPMTASLRTVDWQGVPAGPVALEATVFQRESFNVQEQDRYGNTYWTRAFSDTAVFTTSVAMGANGLGRVVFTPTVGGEYRIVAVGSDDRSNVIRSSTWVWVSSRAYVSWPRSNSDRVTLVADKKAYAPGDTAHVLIQSPYQVRDDTAPVRAWVTVERGRILHSQVVTLASNSDVLDISVTPDMAPNAFVSVFLLKGTDAIDARPSFKMGYTGFDVDRRQHELAITLTPDKRVAGDHYRPRDPITYTVKVVDAQGRPVRAEVSLALVDLSVLSLRDPFESHIADHFYYRRWLSVWTGSSLSFLVDQNNVRLAEEAKGGGGGASQGDIFARSNFVDTAYWNATITTDANGEAVVSLRLPDNLTTWRLFAKAVTADTQVGQAQIDVLSTKDLLVRPITPRFFVAGDKVNLAAVVHNNTTTPLEADAWLVGSGVSIESDIVTHTVSIPANGKVRVEWPVVALDATAADLTFFASGGGLNDASKPTAALPPDQHLPIYTYSASETVATSGSVSKGERTRVEVVALPENKDTTQGELTVHIDPSLAAAMAEGLKYLEHFPHECAEQAVSRFLPNVLTTRALQELGLADAELEANLKRQVEMGLQRLYGQQHADGGWGWWATDESSVTVSTYAMLGLVKAQQAGFAVDAGVLERGIGYLASQILPTDHLDSTTTANRQAYLLYVLVEARQAGALPETIPSPTGSLVALYDEKRGLLGHYGKALLALGLSLDQPEERSRVDTVLNDLVSSATASATGMHWEEAERDYRSWDTDTRSTAIILDALARLDPHNALTPNVVRWLMAARSAGRWETTQETAWSLIALTDWMKATGELNANYDWLVAINGQVLGSGTANGETLLQTATLTQSAASLLSDGIRSSALVINRDARMTQSGDGQLYYDAYLRTFAPVPEVKSLSRGIVVARQYFAREDPCFTSRQPDEESIPCTPVTSAKVGDVLQVKLTIVAPTDLHYVVVEDPLPAGTEAIDTSLKTTSQLSQAPELNRTSPYSVSYGWGWWWFTHSELHDEKVVLFASFLPAGTYEYAYQIRAGLDGVYNVMPAHAEEMYFPEVFGRSNGSVFVIGK